MDPRFAKKTLNTPRNIAFKYIENTTYTFNETYPGKYAERAEGGYYDLHGNWVAQSNNGIIWLTNFGRDESRTEGFRQQYEDGTNDLSENVSRLKHARLDDNKIILVYEIWNQTDYQYSAYMVINDKGEKVIGHTQICYPLRLHRTGDIMFNPETKTIQLVEGEYEGFYNLYLIEESEPPPRSRFEDDEADRKSVV